MTALIIVAAVFAVLAVISLIPISFGVRFRLHGDEKDIDIMLKYGFIQIRLPQKKEQAEEADKPKEKEPPQKKEKKNKDEKSID
ncbi:MAG: hypothetical protein IJH94_04115, partial [Clostridia bacterium]|nr:hypothetical protein [Clostridia bacterium]